MDVVGGWVLVGGCVLVGAWVLVGGCEPMVVVGAVEVADATVPFGGWLLVGDGGIRRGRIVSWRSTASVASVVFVSVVSFDADGVPSAFVASGRPIGIATVVVVAVVAASGTEDRERDDHRPHARASTSVDVYG